MLLTLRLPFLRRSTLSVCSCLPLAFIADLSSLLCLWLLRGSPLHSVITRTLFTLALRSGSMGEPRALCSEPDGVLEGDTDWLVGQPVSSIVNRHTDSRCQEQTAWGRQRTQAGSQSSRPSLAVIMTSKHKAFWLALSFCIWHTNVRNVQLHTRCLVFFLFHLFSLFYVESRQELLLFVWSGKGQKYQSQSIE